MLRMKQYPENLLEVTEAELTADKTRLNKLVDPLQWFGLALFACSGFGVLSLADSHSVTPLFIFLMVGVLIGFGLVALGVCISFRTDFVRKLIAARRVAELELAASMLKRKFDSLSAPDVVVLRPVEFLLAETASVRTEYSTLGMWSLGSSLLAGIAVHIVDGRIDIGLFRLTPDSHVAAAKAVIRQILAETFGDDVPEFVTAVV